MNQRRVPGVLMAAIAAAGLLVACADDTVESTGSESPATSPTVDSSANTAVGTSLPNATDGSTPPMTNAQIDPGLKPYTDLAVSDLAQRLSIEAATIEVVSAELVEWPDSALGCPEPGMQYAQVSTDGSKIVLMANGTQYRYHAGGSRTPFLCEQPAKGPSTSG